jgi:hypothetical protein
MIAAPAAPELEAVPPEQFLQARRVVRHDQNVSLQAPIAANYRLTAQIA